MERRVLPILAGLLAAGTFACAPGPQGETVARGSDRMGPILRVEEASSARAIVVPQGKATTWRAVFEAYSALDIPVARVDSAAGIVENPRIRTSRRLAGNRLSRYFDCGRTAFGREAADEYILFINLTTQVQALAPDSSRVTTSVDATARDPSGTSTEVVRCGSRGALEETVLRATYQQLGQG